MSGKGSRPRPLSVDRSTYENNWDKIFKSEYQDILSTEDCVVDVFNEIEQNKDEERQNLFISDPVNEIIIK